jgi:alpha-glucosidase
MTGFDLSAPHHDGSERHVSTLEPSIGDTVSVWLRVPHADPADHVWVRTTPDAEPLHTAAVVDRTTPHETWWRAEIGVRNPVTNYRFLLDGGRSGYRYVNGTGVHARAITDTADFRLSAHPPPPAWAADSVFYQVFPDRFALGDDAGEPPRWATARSWDDPVVLDGKRAVAQWYGGTLDGIEAHLDHFVGLGAGGLYLTPVFPAPSSHRYNADTFDHVDPLLGGDDAFARLVKSCHNRGIRVIGDLTVNHAGSGHEWFRTAQGDPTSVEAGFFFFRDHPDDYEAWFDVPTLPKLDLRNAELRSRLVAGADSVTGRWLRPPFDLDGWRVDVANMAGRLGEIDVNHEIARTMRATMAEAKLDAYLVAEHCYDASHDLDGDGWHGVMNYAAFTRPAWCWLRGDDDTMRYLGDPAPIPRFGGRATARSMQEALAVQPWRSSVSGFNLLGSHDTTRFRTVCGTSERQIAGAGLLFTYPGVPMIFAGDELGLTGVGGDGARQPMPWEPARWDHDVLDAYRALGALHRSSPGLRHGGLRWVHVADDVLVYLREALDERLLVQIARADHEAVTIDVDSLDGMLGERRIGPAEAVRGSRFVELPADGPAVHVWQLDPRPGGGNSHG